MQIGKKRVGDEATELAGNYPPSNALSHPLDNGTCSSVIINAPIVNYYIVRDQLIVLLVFQIE